VGDREIEEPQQKVFWLIGYLLAHQAGITADVGTAVPRALVVTREEPGDAHLLVFEPGPCLEAVEEGRRLIAGQKEHFRAWALVYDAGLLPGGRADGDALLVEAGVEGWDGKLTFLQRYRPKSGTAPFQLLGEVEPAGEWPPMVRQEVESLAWDGPLRQGIESHPLAAESWAQWH
jgi:hypothetical protein